MKLIKEYDYKDYKVDGTVGVRPSVRAIIIKDKKLALVYSEKYDYYTFAGGGIDEGETMEEALVREIREELGLEVIPQSIREYGLMVRKEKGRFDDLFIQENYYFVCDVSNQTVSQKLEGYEAEEGYALKWVTPREAIETNKVNGSMERDNEVFYRRLLERENWLIERLVLEGRFE